MIVGHLSVSILFWMPTVFALIAKEPAPTPAPKRPFGELGRRAVTQNCGYIYGDSSAPVTCGVSSTCTFAPSGHWGCCDAISCYNPGTCVGEGTAYCGGLGTASCPYSQIQSCTGPTPACITFIRQTGVDDPSKQTSWGCATTPTVFIVLAVPTGSGSAALTSGGSVATSDTTASAGSSVPTNSATPTSTPSPQPAPDSGLTKAATIATVISLVIGLPALIVAIWQIIRWMRGRP